MEQEPEVVEVLQKIVKEPSDEERRRIEAEAIKPYDSGVHPEDPEQLPETPEESAQ